MTFLSGCFRKLFGTQFVEAVRGELLDLKGGTESNLGYHSVRIHRWHEWGLCLKATCKRRPTPMGENVRWKHCKMCLEFIHSCCTVSVLCLGILFFSPSWVWHPVAQKAIGQGWDPQPGCWASNHPCLSEIWKTQLPSGWVILLLPIRKSFPYPN